MKLETRILLKQVAKWIVKSVIGLSGPQGLVATLVIDYFLKWGWIQLSDLEQKLSNKIESDKEVKESLNDYKKVINDPKSSADDVSKAGDDLLNS